MESCSCVVTFSPGVLPRRLLPRTQTKDFQVFSALDVLDYILQLLFGIHVEGLPGLYRCQLQKKTRIRKVCMKLRDGIRKWVRAEEQTSMLVALSFSSITCFRMVREDLMASFNVMD